MPSVVQTSLTIREVATRYRISPTTVRRWVLTGRLPGWFLLGRDHYLMRADLDAFDANLVQRAACVAGGGDPDGIPTPHYVIPPSPVRLLPEERRRSEAKD